MARNLVVSRNLVIPASELKFSFVRSAGPGGQNVNKVNTKAVLRWQVVDSPSLSEAFRARFVERYAGRINSTGELIISSDQHREQSRNRNECLSRLAGMAAAVLQPPRSRIQTRPTRSAVERRLRDKQHRSQAKQRRRFRPADE